MAAATGTTKPPKMNCYYHPDRPAVAQCVDCGKGLCQECASRNKKKIPLCPDCAKKRLTKAIGAGVVYFIVLGIIYIIGYEVGTRSNNHESFGYLFMAIWTGLSLMSGKFEVPVLATFLAPTAGCLLTIVKFVLATVIGVILCIPIALWNLYILIRNIYYLSTWQKVK